jgi:ABC-type nitrate/sulfonate/bicarbonate transport system substrate-binding protein
MTKEVNKATQFIVEVPEAYRKAFHKILRGLEEAEIISSFQEDEQGPEKRVGGRPAGQNEQMRQYHDLLD